MYEAHFGFHRQPFQSADACRAFFISESIQEILPQLLHALRSDLGIAVLTGVPGSGKTSLLRHIQQQLANEGRVIVCSGANLGTSADLIGALLEASRMKSGAEATAKPVSIDRVVHVSRSCALDHMKRTAELWGPVMLLIDDVQLVPLPVLNELRACTEEEWNGRDLVRCLVSAPISFEDQLARQDYSDFARRIRCHAFLQPLKSSESVLFLKDQIELAGGQHSNIFTASALTSIITAAGGNPRCLGLLADETLVIAAMCVEKIASEKSVRTALSRLQHLQYHWNTSPYIDDDEIKELDSVPTNTKSKSAETIASSSASASPTLSTLSATSTASAMSASTTPAATRFTAPVQATIAPGVIEFGGPTTSFTRPTAGTPPLKATLPAPIQQISDVAEHSDDVDVSGSVELPAHILPGELAEQHHELRTTAKTLPKNLDDRAFSDITQTTPRNTAFEFGSEHSIIEAPATSMAPNPHHRIPEFEVGQRFESESMEESISIDEVENRDILELLNKSSEMNFDDVGISAMNALHASEHGEVSEAKILWFDGNTSDDEKQPAVETDLVNVESPSLSIAEEPAASATLSEAELLNEVSERESHNGVATGKFFDTATAKLSNRLPVFDRYTWLALGREVPAGRNSVVSMSVTRQLIQSDYSILRSGLHRAISSLPSNLQRIAAIDQIPISVTTDAALIAEINRDSRNVQSGVYVVTGAGNFTSAKSSTTLECAKSISIAIMEDATSTDANGSFDSHSVVEISHEENQHVDSEAALSSVTPEDSVDENAKSQSGLRIWRDGMLVFSNGKPTDNINAPDSAALSHESNPAEHNAIEASNEFIPTPAASSDDNLKNRNLVQLGAGGFFTLPDPKPQHADGLSSLKISQDEDVYPLVEAMNNIRNEVRSFQDNSPVPDEDADSGSRFSESPDSSNQPDNVVSRAKRRLDDRANSTDANTMALQFSPEARGHQKNEQAIKTQPETESVFAADGTRNSETAPNFGRLFTRLRLTRRLAADQAQADV